MAIESVNPATGERLRLYEEMSAVEVDARLATAWRAYQGFREEPLERRAGPLNRLADLLLAEREPLARLMTLEVGKPIGASVAEVEKCAWACRFYAENAGGFLAAEEVSTNAERSYVRYEPIGPVLAVMPWNFPLWQVFRFAAPAVMAGNAVLLKHASNVPGCALAIEELFARAGFPEGVFQTLLVGTGAVAGLIDDHRVRGVTLTGSTAAGSAVAERAGARIKKTVLELGGSDPFIVMPSANLAEAARSAVAARTINNGQSCIAAKRFIVHQAVYEEFERRFVAGLQGLRVGDPLDPETEIGPLATPAIRDEVHGQVTRSIELGAQLLCGGVPLEGPGNFYPPTALAKVPQRAPAYRDEIFGPVAALFSVRDVDEAISLANDSVFGLGSSVWTAEPRERERFVSGLEAGQVFVNAMVASDPRLPFGGVKHSGYGRELGAAGLREFVNVKTVWVAGASGGRRLEPERSAPE